MAESAAGLYNRTNDRSSGRRLQPLTRLGGSGYNSSVRKWGGDSSRGRASRYWLSSLWGGCGEPVPLSVQAMTGR